MSANDDDDDDDDDVDMGLCSRISRCVLDFFLGMV